MQLTGGGTVTLELVLVDDAAARYRALLTTPGGECRAEVSVALAEGDIAWSDWTPAPPPEWLLEYARQFLRSAWRARGQTAWPGRIHRWRDAR